MATETISRPVELLPAYLQTQRRIPGGHPGERAGYPCFSRAMTNANKVAQVKSITVGSAADSTLYTVFISGFPIYYTSGAGATTTTIAAGIAAAILAEEAVNGAVTATSAVAVVTVTGLRPGMEITIYSSDSALTVASVTAASDGTDVEFGKLVCSKGETGSDGDQLDSMVLPSPNTPVAKVITSTPVAVDGAEYNITVITNGDVGYDAHITAATPAVLKDIVEGLAAQLNAKLPASTVIVTEDDLALILTAETAGEDFEVEVGSNSATATWSVVVTVANTTLGLDYSVAGIVEFDHGQQDGVIKSGRQASIGYQGDYWVIPEQVPSSRSAAVYLRHTVGSDTVLETVGNLRTDSDSGKAILLEGISWETTTRDNAGRIKVSLNRPKINARLGEIGQ